jgi:complement component 1 Q subcomponent-binding protein
MMEYLKGYGVNEELAAVVEHLSLDKEQRLYMGWLKEVSEFIGTN